MEVKDISVADSPHSGLTPDFTLEELFSSMSEEQISRSDEGLTSQEWSEFFHKGRDWGRHFVRRMLDEGQMVRGKRYIENISGAMQPVKVFRFTDEAKARYAKSGKDAAKSKDARRK